MSAPESRWRELLALALPALDHVYGQNETEHARWTLGGGTAIAVTIEHRISYDIDLFVPGTPLKLFTPQHNLAAKQISTSYQWPGHMLKYERPEGEIDFLSPALQTEPGYAWHVIDGRRIAVELPEEVIVKKIRFRSARFTARDVFDLAAVARTRPGLSAILALEVPDALHRTRESLDLHARRGLDALGASISPTASFSGLIHEAFSIGRDVLTEAAVIANVDRE